VKLLERDSRNVALTASGIVLLREGRKALSQARRTVRAARAAGAPRLTVGFYGSAATSLLPDVLRELEERLPAAHVSVRELLLGTIDEILDGSVELAFTRLVPGQTELEVEVLATEPRVAALPSNHPLAAGEMLTFGDLRRERFIVNPAVKNGEPPTRWLAEQRRHGLRGRIAAEATSVQEILALVAAGRGICLVPVTVAEHHPRADIAYVPVLDAEPAVISLARPPGRVSPAAGAFLEAARDVAARTGPCQQCARGRLESGAKQASRIVGARPERTVNE
jgi:DNA-binding transcriptional LysR family regulator